MLMHIQASRTKDESGAAGAGGAVQGGKTKLLGVAAGIMKGDGLRSLTSRVSHFRSRALAVFAVTYTFSMVDIVYACICRGHVFK